MSFDEYFQIISDGDHYWGTSTWEEYHKIIEEQRILYNQAIEEKINEDRARTQTYYDSLTTKFVDAPGLLAEFKKTVFYDCCGCYVFLIFDEPVTGDDYSSYRSVYVGQSENVGKRVKNHLTGHGNGDVYADFKYGKYVYVKIILCDYTELDDTERNLIYAYDAQNRGYNKTQGGSKGF